MRRPVELSIAAERDRVRLAAFLVETSPRAAERAVDTIIRALAGLSDFPERGPEIGEGLRELIIPFGASGYVAQYRVQADRVVVARLFHMREDRPD